MNTNNQSSTSSSYSSPTINPYQILQNQGAAGFQTNSLLPAAGSALSTGMDLFNNAVGGVNNAAGVSANYANQLQNIYGNVGASKYATGSQGLHNLFSADYVQQQMAAATIPAQ